MNSIAGSLTSVQGIVSRSDLPASSPRGQTSCCVASSKRHAPPRGGLQNHDAVERTRLGEAPDERRPGELGQRLPRREGPAGEIDRGGIGGAEHFCRGRLRCRQPTEGVLAGRRQPQPRSADSIDGDAPGPLDPVSLIERDAADVAGPAVAPRPESAPRLIPEKDSDSLESGRRFPGIRPEPDEDDIADRQILGAMPADQMRRRRRAPSRAGPGRAAKFGPPDRRAGARSALASRRSDSGPGRRRACAEARQPRQLHAEHPDIDSVSSRSCIRSLGWASPTAIIASIASRAAARIAQRVRGGPAASRSAGSAPSPAASCRGSLYSASTAATTERGRSRLRSAGESLVEQSGGGRRGPGEQADLDLGFDETDRQAAPTSASTRDGVCVKGGLLAHARLTRPISEAGPR